MDITHLKYDDNTGLITAVVQNVRTLEVLMVAYMNEESLKKTLDTKTTWFYSRSRRCLWHKGETSGNFQHVKDIRYDCDKDALLVLVDPEGPSCHTGNNTCFYRNLTDEEVNIPNIDLSILQTVYELVEHRRNNPIEGSYTNYLFDKGIDKILKKVGEETTETVIAAKNNSKEELIYETSDLIYHLMVLLVNQEVTLDEICMELEKRHKE